MMFILSDLLFSTFSHIHFKTITSTTKTLLIASETVSIFVYNSVNKWHVQYIHIELASFFLSQLEDPAGTLQQKSNSTPLLGDCHATSNCEYVCCTIYPQNRFNESCHSIHYQERVVHRRQSQHPSPCITSTK